MEVDQLSLAWALPFGGILLSIAFCPLLVPSFWHKHYGKISASWSAAYLVPLIYCFGFLTALQEIIHIYGHHFLPFIILISTLYIISTHIHLDVKGTPTPTVNMLFLLTAALSANFLGTVGAAMIFIRPFLALNKARQHKTHSVIFFIFLVCNIGGCLTAIGDPPLFLGFLAGIDFFWPLSHLFVPFLLVAFPLLIIYWLIDTYYRKREGPLQKERFHLSLQGIFHIVLLLIAMGLIISSGVFRNLGKLSLMGLSVSIPNIMRDIGLMGVAYLSYKKGSSHLPQRETLDWKPLTEVALLFAGIFMTASPVIAMLKDGTHGPFGFLIEKVSTSEGAPVPLAYFWMTGILSSFLDNAPTYLIFYNLVGAEAAHMMTTFSPTLTAISAGSVFMGAITYIGNAPNFMVKSLAESSHIQMPSFFHYMLWSIGCLGPSFLLLSWFFH